MNEIVLVYITNPTKREARKIAKHLLNQRLVACVNILGAVNSLYRWQGKIADEKEFIVIAKTNKASFGKVKAEVEKIHCYTVPCVVEINASVNEKYFDWLKGEIGESM